MSTRTPSAVFPEVLRAAIESGASERAMARAAGMSHNTLRDWLLGYEPAAFGRLEALAESVGLTITVQKCKKLPQKQG